MSRKIEEFELTAFALGEVDEETRVLIEAELLVNQEARELVEEIKRAVELVRVELAESSDESAPALHPEQLARIARTARGPEEKANASDRARKPHRRGRVIAIASAIGLCAVAFLAVTSMMVMRASTPQEVGLASISEVQMKKIQVESAPEGASVQMQQQQQQQQQGESANYLAGRPRSRVESGRDGKVLNNSQNNIDLVPNDPTTAARFQRAPENDFHQTRLDRLSTFSIDVDTASYGIVRRYLSHSTTPPRDSIRVEEMINYFDWDLPPPEKDPIAIYADVTDAPWKSDHLLARVALKAKEIDQSDRKPMNIVFLIDVSGSMAPNDRLPLLKRALALFVPTLTERDRMAIVVYAGASGLVLPPTPGDRHREILAALERLGAGGSTNGGAGIQLAYDTAVGAFISGGANRVVLATDGDFNVGVTSQQRLIQLIEAKARSNVFLTVLGFGMSNLNDAMLEQLADHGDGNYAYVDDLREAQRVLIEKAGSTLETIAKDVKVQIDFNPKRVASYRLIGYENRLMAAHEFNNDAKDAGEMGSGHAVTMLYEIVPVSGMPDKGDMFTVKVRYKAPEGGASRELQKGVGEKLGLYDRGREDLKFAAAIAELAMVLSQSPHRGNATLQEARELARAGLAGDPHGQRSELLQLIRRAEELEPLR